jgi:serine/threonine protein kinase
MQKEAQSLIKLMMHKNAADRIKIPQIKAHPWFALYKVSFSPDAPGEGRESSMTRSGLISDSMLQDGDDPFDDFLNGRIRSSDVSTQGSGNQSTLELTDEKQPSNTMAKESGGKLGIGLNFKKSGKPGDHGFDMRTPILEAIPEERGVSKRVTQNSGNAEDIKEPSELRQVAARTAGSVVSLTDSELERDAFFGGAEHVGRERDDSIVSSLVGFAATSSATGQLLNQYEHKMQREIKELS